MLPNVKLLVAVGVAWIAAGTAITVKFDDVGEILGLVQVVTAGAKDGKKFILESTGNGAVIFDFDNDGDNDVFITNGTVLEAKESAPSLLYRNENGKFREVAREAGLTATGWAQAVCAGDINNDGNIDLFVTYYGVNRLFLNKGKKLEDVSKAVGLPIEGRRWGAGCSLLDFDRDGRLDIFVSNYVELDLAKTPGPGSMTECIWKGLSVFCGPRGLPLAKNALYHQRPDGTFEDVSAKAGILKPGGRYGLGVVASDFDNDGWPDIYVACDQTPSLLYQNKRDGTFVERGVEAGVAYNFDGRLQAGMGVAVADFDGNGFLDIAKTNFSGDLPSLYLNEDGKFFRDISQQAGLGVHQLLGWGVAFVDVDEDGWKDLIMANGHVYPEVDRASIGDRYRQPTLLYRNLGNGKFADITAQAGRAFEKLRPARGLATGDLNGDGHPEIVIVNMNEPPSVIQGQGRYQNWVKIELQGMKSNRSAIGARVTVDAGGRKQVDEVRAGGSYYSQHELALHFGLGSAKAVDKIEVRWPNGLIEHWTKLEANRTHKLVEGSAK